MASNESSSVPARLKDLKESVKERFLGLLGIRQPKVLLEDEQEVFLQVGRTVWHAPRQLRIELWLSSLARRHSLVSEYQTYLSQEIAREASTDIEKDVQRTFPNTRRFHAEEGQAQLRNVLRAYAAYDPDVAYCQGMNFLTGLLLMYMPTEAHAFAALVVLMEDRKLRSFYHRSMSLLQVQLWQLSRLISPALNHHLEALGVVPMLYGASWLMTAFSADFPIPFSARIMDVLLGDQCECALLKVAAAIMKAVGPKLHTMHDLEEVLGHLKIEVPAWEEPELHDLLTAAFTKPWTARQLNILSSTEGAETVAQAMDRVMNMNLHEHLNSHTCEEEEAGEDGSGGGGGGDGEARVAVPIPRLQPPPQPSSSFAASPAGGTPVNGGLYGTGSHSGAVSGSPPPAPPAGGVRKCGAGSCGGDGTSAVAAVLTSMSSNNSGGGGGGGGDGSLLLVQAPVSVNSSPATWSIPCIHPNVPASPAIQAFRRAHLPSFQAAVSSSESFAAALSIGALASQQSVRRSSGGGGGGLLDGACRSLDGPAALAAAAPEGDGGGGCRVSPQSSGYTRERRESEGSSTDEWGEFNAAAVRQQWRSVVRAAPGATRHVLMHSDELLDGAAASAVVAASGISSFGGAMAAPPTPASRDSSCGSASQPIPVPHSRGTSNSSAIGSAFAAAASAAAAAVGSGVSSAAAAAAASAATIGKPPLPPRCASLERGGQALQGLSSRLSVVAEDPLVQIGAVAPAPSPRGSMDIHALGRSGSQPLDSGEEHGLLLCGAGFAGVGGAVGGAGSATGATGGAGGTASCNGDFVSGTASATTGGAMMSPSAISGAVSPHGLASPRVMVAWSASALAGGSGGGSGGGATGSDTPTAGYVPVGLHRAVSGSLLDYRSAYGGGVGGGANAGAASLLPNRCYSLASPLMAAATAAGAAMEPSPFGSPPHSQSQLLLLQPEVEDLPQAAQQQQEQQADMATDIAGDILRMLSAVDTGNAHAAYDPRVILGESMYADSPNKEEHKLVRTGSENLRHLPSSSMLAEIAAQDLAKAQEEAERVRLELEAQLQQQRATERLSCSTSAVAAAGILVAANVAATTTTSVAAVAEAAAPAADAAAVGGFSEVPADEAEAMAAEAAEAAGEAAGGGGSGADDWIFKRPKLYVDGIPMFDPKSLMSDTQEAQVMFTPTVSPGASSYADPVLGAFTPGGDAVTPMERDGGVGGDGDGAAAASPEAEVWELQDSAAGPSPGGEDSAPLASEAAGTDCAGAPAAAPAGSPPQKPQQEVPMSAVGLAREDGGAAAGAPVQSADATTCGSEPSAASAAAAGTEAKAPRAGNAAAADDDDLRSLPSASEWVDWSQAPPIHAAATVVLPPSETLGTAPAAPTFGVEISPPTSPSNLSAVLPLAAAAAVHGTIPLPDMPPQGPMGHAGTADLDLIDMASPARPFAAGVVSLPSDWAPCGGGGGAAEAAGGKVTCTGTGLSPGPPVAPPPALLQGRAACQATSASFSDLAAAAVAATGGSGSVGIRHSGFPSSSPAVPYGLLPMTSSVTSIIPQMASELSFASTVTDGSCGGGGGGAAISAGGSFVSQTVNSTRSVSLGGILRTHLQTLSHPRYDSLGVNLRYGSHGGVLYGSTGAAQSYSAGGQSAPEQPTQPAVREDTVEPHPASLPPPAPGHDCMLPKQAPSLGDAVGEYDASAPEICSHGVDGAGTAAAAAAEDKARGNAGLLVLAEVMVSESSAPEPEASLTWDSPSSTAGATGGDGHGASASADLTASFRIDNCDLPQLHASFDRQEGTAAGRHVRHDVEVKTPGTVGGGGGGAWMTGERMGMSYAAAEASLAPSEEDGAQKRGALEAIEHQATMEALDALMEGEEAEQSPYRAALSPSLAHHIMSAYLRSEQHQLQQEQRELQERLAAEQQQLMQQRQQQQLQQQHLQEQQLQQQQQQMASSGASGLLEPAAVELVVTADGATTVAAVLPPPLPPQTAASAFGAVVAHLAVVEELSSLCHVPATTMASSSGLASPALGSPGRPGAGYGTYGTSHPSYHGQQVATKPLTPFAFSLENPSSSRLSAEVLQAMPPPPLPLTLQPDTPTPQLQAVSAGGSLAAESRTIASGRTSLSCQATNEGDGVTGVVAAAVGGYSSGGAAGISRLSESGGHALPLLGQNSHEGTTCTALVPAGPAAAVAASTVCSTRTCGGGGAAVMPLLPPPPPPQVPLCQTAVRLEATSGPTPALPLASLPLPLPPVLCSSSATVLCVADGDGGTAGATACTPVAAAVACVAGGCAAATTAPAQPAPPTWTATFDGVDDETPTSDAAAAATTASSSPAPRVLSSAFAAEADSPPPPLAGGYDSGSGAAVTATATGVSTPEARVYTPDMARGMSLGVLSSGAAPSGGAYQNQNSQL